MQRCRVVVEKMSQDIINRRNTMNRLERRQRSLNACLIAGIVHLGLAILFTFFYYTRIAYNMDDVLAADLIKVDDSEKQKRQLIRPPLKKPITAKTTKTIADSRPRHVALKASSNPIDETVRPSEKILMHSATEDISKTVKELPEVTSDAKLLNSSTAEIAKSVASPYEITSGSGVKSLRQRAKGDGDGGFHRLKSTGAADVGSLGKGIGEGGSGENSKESKGTNPFREALKEIANHIIATRTLDKVNVVFVLDTSASMRDNIQEVADNLYTMTDAFDLANIEYHFGMSEFSVRQKGQQLLTRSLLPDASMLRRRMQEVQLSGDENALDALVDTLNFMEFHADAEKHLILVTDEPVSTSLREENAKENMQDKVVDESQFDEIRVNVLGFPEPFQKRLCDATGGIWQQIPGDIRNPTSLPNNRVGNQKFLRVFREIAMDMQRGSRKMFFSLDLKFDVVLEETDDLLNKIQQQFNQTNIATEAYTFNLEKVSVLENHTNDLWLISDNKNQKIYALKRDDDNISLYAGNSPKYWSLDENLIARTYQNANTWTLTDHIYNQVYTLVRNNDRINVYFGGHPSTKRNRSSEPIIDIMVMLDYSRSMGGKSQAIMLGLSEMLGRLSILPVQYRIGLTRFAEGKDAIKVVDGVIVGQMPLNEVIIESLMQDPFGGDEHLIDAIIEGLPKVKFSPYAQRFLLVLTDEPTTGKHPAEKALRLCQSLGVSVYVIGHPDPNDFQSELAKQTRGIFYPMPKHLDKAYPNQ